MADEPAERQEVPICNVCGKAPGEAFYARKTDICPHCTARERHRCLQDAMRNDGLAAALDLPGKTVLACHLIGVERMIFGDSARFINFDARPLEGLDLRMDIHDMSQIESASMDGVIAIHVLNHVRDEARALDEIKRVLKPGGFFLSTVGYHLNLPTRGVADQTRDYGAEALEKLSIGTYRTYNPDDYFAFLENWFPTERFAGRDPLSGIAHQIFLSRKS